MLPSIVEGLLREAIRSAIRKNVPFYAYRLPYTTDFRFGAQITPLKPYKKGEEGFLLAPFNAGEYPKLFIKDEINLSGGRDDLQRLSVAGSVTDDHIPNRQTSYREYCEGSQRLIADMKSGRYRKAVLSRIINYEAPAIDDADEWFVRLSLKYSGAFVFIVSVPGVTTWMGATPELLLKCDGENLVTMALAATRVTGERRAWSSKEETEQKIVTDYIKEQFAKAGIEPELSGLTVAQAGPVEHLCNIITAPAADSEKTDKLLSLLHPTPAVAGSPLMEALIAIKRAENRSRRYYGGYLGPVGAGNIFSLFVNLRSMELFDDMAQLYVGGGLTAESETSSEWQETEHKAETILDCIKDE